MFESELQRKIADFRKIGIPQYLPRDCPLHMAKLMVSTAIGARRAGKSFRALQAADELITQKAIPSLRHICHVDFDNPILSAMKAADLKTVQSVFLKASADFDLTTPLVFVFDEIHKVLGWEEYVVDLSRNPNWRVIVTGSSSKMLRGDIATELRGKSISSEVYPLTFAECVRFRGTDVDTASTQGAAASQRLFDGYLHWGSYPAVPGMEEQAVEPLLRDYFDTMIFKDIVNRHQVSKPALCMDLYRYLASNIAKPFTLSSAYAYVKNAGYSTSRDMVRDLVSWSTDAWFLFAVPVFSDSVKEQDRNYKKLYCIDWALANMNGASWDGSYSRALENVVYIHLRRRYHRVHYYLTRTDRLEIDFVGIDSRGQPSVCVQVCMNPTPGDTLKRELAPMAPTSRHFGIKENLLITYNHEAQYEVEGIKVQALPAWKWLLQP